MADAATPELHFCVLIHGLWGNPNHLQILANTLRKAHPEDTLHILLAKSNSGNFTYDGIEKGAERTMHEIEGELKALEDKGKKVTKLSVTGYSLGGLVARYIVGLFYSKGYFERMQPINFTTFATPHLGTRSPILTWSSDLFNALGPRTLSMSGKQLWAVDSFRGTGKPLLSVLADPDGIFLRGLRLFRNRFLYANIVNDRAVPFFTAYFNDTDPFTDLSAIDIHYEPGYDNVIVSETLANPKKTPLGYYESLASQSQALLYKMPFYLAFGVLGPVAAVVYLGNAGIQSFKSAARIKEHEEGTAGLDVAAYHLPSLMERAQQKTDSALKQLADAASNEGHAANHQNPPVDEGSRPSSVVDETSRDSSFDKDLAYPHDHHTVARRESHRSEFPKLALSEEQLAMKSALDSMGFQKFAVHIKNANHSHAAIIIRMQRPGFGEGKVISKHWLERFEI